MKANPLFTWARTMGGHGRVRGGRGDGDGYEGAPPDVKREVYEDRPQVLAWIDLAPRDIDRPDNPPAWVANEATWERAKKAVEPRWGNYSEPYAVVAHVYENMGGTIK